MKKLTILLIGSIFFSFGLVYSQTEEDRINFYDGAFFLVEEDYSEALSAFKKVYNAGFEDNANLNYLIGVCNLKIHSEKPEAVKYLTKAISNVTRKYSEGNFKEESAPYEAYLFLGNAYRINEDLDNAILNYEKYISFLEDNQEYELLFTNTQIENCKRAKKAIQNPINLEKENLGNLYNSRFNNFNPVRSGDGQKIAYMTEQRFYDAIYYVEFIGGRWSNPINVTPQIQSDGDQYVTSLSMDGTKMFLSRINIDDADIMMSTYSSKRWSKSKNIGKPVNTKYFESHACISPDGKNLYFISNRKESLGGMDIFVSELLEDGKSWSEPVNLGSTINTLLNEDSPFLSSDGKTLYFSSQGHDNIGGYDIFFSKLDGSGNWSKPVPYAYPLNTTDDDLFFSPIEDGSKGYMAKFEEGGLGGEDIYLISIKPEETLAEEAIEETVLEEESIILEEVIEQQEEVEIEDLPDIKYSIKPVFFGFDSSVLSDIAKSKLDVLTDIMTLFPELKIEINAHTDAMGPVDYNQYLSLKRANSVEKYLIQKGLENKRLILNGFSENKPIAINKTAEGLDSSNGRQLNRRVEFKVISKQNEQIVLEVIKVPDHLKIK